MTIKGNKEYNSISFDYPYANEKDQTNRPKDPIVL